MTENIRVYIERVKAKLDVVTDQQLADKLGYSKQTIASWRRRNHIPVEAETRIIRGLGPRYARSPEMIHYASARQSPVVTTASLYVCERFLSSLKRTPSMATRLSIGSLYLEIEFAMTNELVGIGISGANELAHENVEAELEAVLSQIDAQSLASVNSILARVDLDGNEIQTVKKVPQ